MELESKLNDSDNNSDENEDEDVDDGEDKKFPVGMSLEEKYERVVNSNRLLKREIQSKNVLIGTLRGEVDKRDRILHLSSIQTDDVEVLLNFTPEGHPIYEIMNKQQIPFWIKTEQLCPLPQIISNFKETPPENCDEEDSTNITQFTDEKTETEIVTDREISKPVHAEPSTSKSNQSAFIFQPEETEEISNDPESFELENLEISQTSENIQCPDNLKNLEFRSVANSKNSEDENDENEDEEIEDGEIDSDSPDEDDKNGADNDQVKTKPEIKIASNIFKTSTNTSLLELGRVSPISISSLSSVSSVSKTSSQIKIPPAPPPPKISLKFDSPGPSKSSRRRRISYDRRIEEYQEEEYERLPEKRTRILRYPQLGKISPPTSNSKSKSKTKSKPQNKTTTHISIQIRVSEDSEQRIITETETESRSQSHKGFPRISLKPESESESKAKSTASSSSNISFSSNPQPFIPDLESLDYGFWADTRNSDTPKFFITFHDNFYDWEDKDKSQDKEEKFYTLIQQLEHRPPEIIRMSLRDIFKRVERFTMEKHKARIWLDVRNPGIFSHPKSSLFNLSVISSSVTHFHLGPRLHLRTVEEHETGNGTGVKCSLFLEFIFRHLPHLEFLAINSDLLSSFDIVRELRGGPLTKLRTLHFIQSKTKSNSSSKSATEMYGHFLRKIFKKAPNLVYLYGIPLQSLDSDKIEDGKIRSFSCLSYARLELGVHDFQTQLSILGKCRKFDRLEELDTRTSFIKNMQVKILCIQSISKILSNNLYTIKTLHLEAAGPKKGLKIPTLRRLEKIIFHMNPNPKIEEATSTSFFPKEMGIRDFITKFPALLNVEIAIEIEKNLNMDMDVDTETDTDVDLESGTEFKDGATNSSFSGTGLALFEKNFPPRIFTKDTFLNVRGLTLRNFCPIECFPKIPIMFSNTRVLRLCHRASDVGAVLQLVFKHWKGLQWLILEVDTDGDGNGNLDAGLTGIDKDVCDNLKDNMQQLEDPQIIQRIQRQRINLPISHLSELTFLRFVLKMGNTFDISRPIMTSISALFGFGKELMPKLTVQLGFHESVTLNEKELMISSLSSILPFVILES